MCFYFGPLFIESIPCYIRAPAHTQPIGLRFYFVTLFLMNTSRAVLCSPHAISTPHPRFPLNTYKILVASILMMSLSPAQSQESSQSLEAQKVIPGEDMSQLFEGFTPKLKYDPEYSTWNI